MEKVRSRKSDIIKVIVLSIIIIWIICFFIDYFRARQSKNPVFCLTHSVTEYSDGTTYSCTGFGYKFYRYERTSIPISVQFGPFFIQERT